jgi:hypothetical protein
MDEVPQTSYFRTGWFGGTSSLQETYFLAGVGHNVADTGQKIKVEK